jgi:hypothetical protein
MRARHGFDNTLRAFKTGEDIALACTGFTPQQIINVELGTFCWVRVGRSCRFESFGALAVGGLLAKSREMSRFGPMQSGSRLASLVPKPRRIVGQ